MQDIILENNSLKIIDGDFEIGKSDNQHIESIFESHKGEFKESPEIGFGVSQYLKTNVSKLEFKRALKVELERDGFENLEINIDKQGILNVDIN